MVNVSPPAVATIVSRTLGANMKTWTVWVRDANGEGTTHISAHKAETIEAAVALAVEETAGDWQQPKEALEVLGIAEGDVKIVEWND